MSELRPVESVRVVIADDHPFYRRGLGRLLRKCGIDVVGEAPNGEAAIVAAQEAAPDVVIMDLNMPGLSGAEATRRLLDRAPKSRVLVLSATAQDSDVTEAFFVGASGYLTKDLPVDELVEGIRAAAAHRAVVSPHGEGAARARPERDLRRRVRAVDATFRSRARGPRASRRRQDRTRDRRDPRDQPGRCPRPRGGDSHEASRRGRRRAGDVRQRQPWCLAITPVAAAPRVAASLG